VKFPDDAPVTAEKKAALRERLARLGIDLAAVDEQAIRGSGPGGQKKNKTSSGVLLRYPLRRPASPEGEPAELPQLLVIRCSRERQHSLNRFLALRELADAVEQRVSPATSARLQEIARRRKQKARLASRSRQRAADAEHAPPELTAPDKGEDEDEDKTSSRAGD
jgi:protein subunit release factor B